MGKSSAAAPAAPDPVKTAEAQTALNTQAAQDNAKYSAVDMYGPYGSVTYQRDANGVPISQTTSLDPTNKQTMDIQNQIGLTLAGKAQDALSGMPTGQYSMATSAPYDPRQVDTSKLSVWGKGADDFAYNPNNIDVNQINQQAADSVWQAGKARLDPIFAQQNDRNAQTFQDRGLPIDGEAARQVNQNTEANQNGAYLQLQNQAQQTGHQFAQDNINQGQQLRSNAINESLTFNNQANADYLQKLQTEQGLRTQIQNEDMQDRDRAFNEASIWLQGSPVYGTPSQVAAPQYQTQPANYANAAYASHEGNLMAAKLADQRQAATWQGIGQGANAAMGIASNIWMMSSKAFKEELGDADSFLKRVCSTPIRHWRYHGDSADHIGPYAEEFAATFGGPADRIHLGDAIFILWRGVQELAGEVKALRAAAST